MGVKGLRRGWPRRVRKPSAPPSLSALIRADARAGFHKRLCGAHGGERLLPELAEGFWDTQWPRLVRQCCRHLSHGCLDVLLHLTDPYDFQVRPMPAHTLGWLLEAERETGRSIGLEMGPAQQRVVFGRLAQGPIRLRPRDGLALIEKGGISGALAWTWAWGREKDFHRSPAVQEAWKRWCGSRSNREAATQALLAMPAQMRFADGGSSLLDIHQALPGNLARQFLDRLCDGLSDKHARSHQRADVLGMAAWMNRFDRHGWPLDHPVWAQWGEGLCAAVETTQPAGAVQNWVRITVSPLHDPTRAVPGWRWNASMARVVSQVMVRDLDQIHRAHLEGRQPVDDMVSNLAMWLKHTLAIEARLSQWGLMDAAAARAWWTSLEAGDWVDEFLAGQPEGHAHAAWRAWQARRLAVCLPAGGAPRRAVRM